MTSSSGFLCYRPLVTMSVPFLSEHIPLVASNPVVAMEAELASLQEQFAELREKTRLCRQCH